MGPDLIYGLDSSQMVEDPLGGVILVGGCSSSSCPSDALYRLPHAGAIEIGVLKQWPNVSIKQTIMVCLASAG
jgi:hypothetical protein